MSIYGAMRTSISGMNSQADRLSSISDNIANVGTSGYKRSSTEFSTVVLQASEMQYESGAVEVRPRRHVSEQGAFDYSSSVTDLAISGEGFFVVENSSGAVMLTRAGAFVPDQRTRGEWVRWPHVGECWCTCAECAALDRWIAAGQLAGWRDCGCRSQSAQYQRFGSQLFRANVAGGLRQYRHSGDARPLLLKVGRE